MPSRPCFSFLVRSAETLDAMFDGIQVIPDAPSEGSALPLYSSLVGARVMAYGPASIASDKARSGPFIVDDAGAYWAPVPEHPATPMMVSTHAQMHRDPAFSNSPHSPS